MLLGEALPEHGAAGRQLRKVYSQLVLQVDHWKALHERRAVALSCDETDNGLRVLDTRYDQPVVVELAGLDAEVLAATLGETRTLEDIASAVDASADDVAGVLDRLIIDRFVLKEERRYLGLVIPRRLASSATKFTRKWVAA